MSVHSRPSIQCQDGMEPGLYQIWSQNPGDRFSRVNGMIMSGLALKCTRAV